MKDKLKNLIAVVVLLVFSYLIVSNKCMDLALWYYNLFSGIGDGSTRLVVSVVVLLGLMYLFMVGANYLTGSDEE